MFNGLFGLFSGHFPSNRHNLPGGADVAFADQLVFPVGTDAELVTVVAFAVFLRLTGFRIFLAARCIRPFRRGFALIQGFLSRLAEMLPGGFH